MRSLARVFSRDGACPAQIDAKTTGKKTNYIQLVCNLAQISFYTLLLQADQVVPLFWIPYQRSRTQTYR
jgi:hypothetical protein